MTRLVLFVVVLAVLTSTTAQAVTCSTYTTEATCYAQRASCSYNPTTLVCQTGAPAICSDFFRDSTGCTGVAGCAINPGSSVCYASLPVCTTLTQTQCGLRSDCHYTTSCLTGAAAGTIGTYSTGPTCRTAGGFWDDYYPNGTPRCFTNVQEVNLEYACITWSEYANTALACGLHGCSSTGTRCTDPSAFEVAYDTAYTLSSTVHYGTSGLSVAANSLTFSFNVDLPLANLFVPTAPVYTSLVLGVPSLPSAIQSGVCNSVSYQPILGTAILPSTYPSPTDLTARVISEISTHNDLNFTSGTAIDIEISRILSVWKVGGSSIVNSTAISNDLVTISPRVQFDLGWCVANCGCSQQVFSTYTQYTVPFGVVTRTNGDNIAASVRQTSVTIGTYGSVSVSVNSANPMTAALSNTYNAQDTCSNGMQRLFWTVVATFMGEYDSTHIVGLRSLTDVSMVASGYTQTVGVPTNCFGSAPYQVVPPTSCTGGSCVTSILFKSRCQPIGADGLSLQVCAAAAQADRIADMGSNIPYPTILNRVQSFYMYPKSWSASLGITDPSPVPVGQDPSGVVPDLVPVTLTVDVFPSNNATASLTVDYGFSDIPDGVFPTDFLDVVADPTSISLTRNQQTYFGQTITPVVLFPLLSERQSYTLTIDTSTIRVYPLSSTGVQLGSSYLTWAQLKPIAYRSPRSDMAGCATCKRPNIVVYQGLLGLDAFSLPVTTLRSLLPGNGYLITFSWLAILPTSGGPAPGTRRLLAVGDSTVASGTVAVKAYLPAELQTDALNWDQGSASTATQYALGLGIGIPVGVFLLSLGFVKYVAVASL